MILQRLFSKKKGGREIIIGEPFTPVLKSPYEGPSEYSNWKGEASHYYKGKPAYFDPNTNPGMGYRKSSEREDYEPNENYDYGYEEEE